MNKTLFLSFALAGVSLFLPAFTFAQSTSGSAGGPTMCTMQYDPVCGAKQVQCIKAPCHPVYQTYGNQCMLGAEDATFLHKGECTEKETGPVLPAAPPSPPAFVPPQSCTAWFDGCNNCSRAANGNAMCTKRACLSNPEPGYCTAYGTTTKGAGEQANVPPVASSTPAGNPERPGFFRHLWSRIWSWFW